MNDNLDLDIKGSVDITKKLSQSQILLWHKCNGRIKNAGYGPRISNLYSELSILVLQHFGNECLQSFTSSLSLVAIKASKSDAFLMCQATILLIKSIPSPKDFTDFHAIVLELARKNPAILRTLFDRGPSIIRQLGFQHQVRPDLNFDRFPVEETECQQRKQQQDPNDSTHDLHRELP